MLGVHPGVPSGAAPAYAQFGGLSDRLKQAQEAKGEGRQKVAEFEDLGRRRAEARRGGQREAAAGVRRLPGQGRHQVRVARRQRAGAGELASAARVAVHRPRHRWRQRVCRARRHRSHHARPARPGQERGGACRRSRPRDHARDGQAHRPRDPEEQGRLAGRRRSRRSAACHAVGHRRSWPGRPTRTSSATPSIATTRTRRTRWASGWPTRSATRRAAWSDVLKRLEERNKDQEQPNGLFASHPLIKDRIAKIAEADQRREACRARRRSRARYAKHITFDREAARRDPGDRRHTRTDRRRLEGQQGRERSKDAKNTDKEQEGGAKEEGRPARQGRPDERIAGAEHADGGVGRRARAGSARSGRERRQQSRQGGRHRQLRPSSPSSRRASRKPADDA